MSGVGDRHGGAVGYHLLHPLHGFIGENVAPVSPQHQRGAIDLSHTVPQLVRSPSRRPGPGGSHDFVVLPGPFTVGALADTVFQRAQDLFLATAGVFLHPLHKVIEGVQLVGQLFELLDPVRAGTLGLRSGIDDNQRLQSARMA